MTPDRDAVISKIVELAAEQVSADPAAVNLDTNFVADLNYDSLNQVEFVMELEDAFEISISDERADQVRTVGQAVALVWEIVGESASSGGQSRPESRAQSIKN